MSEKPRSEMEPITLIVTALAAGAGSAVHDGAAAALKQAYHALTEKARTRLSRQQNGGIVLTEYEKDPATWEAPLSKALEAAGADSDAELIAAAEALLTLTDEAGSSRGKYVVHAWGNQGTQIGDNNSQDNTFGVP
jgi:hypothetical protein